jgi:hypothetical protein
MSNARIVNTPAQAIPQNGGAHNQTSITTGAVVQPFAVSYPLLTDTRHVMFQVGTASIRVTFDGSSPTSTKGFEYIAGSSGYLTRQMALAMKAIGVSATATLESQELNYL